MRSGSDSPGGSPLRWGILGTGAIAAELVEGIRLAVDAELVAVGSRTEASARRFAGRFGIPRHHASYQALCDDPQVDVVYVATPHALHHGNTLMALAAGKHVLCEKPLALNARQAHEMVTAARSADRFLMEAMWTRTLPLMAEVVRRIRDGAIGEVRQVQADFGFHADPEPGSILFNRDLGGGALLDVGIYPISFAHHLLGPPDHIRADALLGPTGVDHANAALLRWDRGAMALLSSSIQLETPWVAEVVGTTGRVHLERPWWAPEAAVITSRTRVTERLEIPFEGNGYTHEVAEVARCIRLGVIESPAIPHDESVAVMDTLDRIRAEIGVRYPTD